MGFETTEAERVSHIPNNVAHEVQTNSLEIQVEFDSKKPRDFHTYQDATEAEHYAVSQCWYGH
jgi:hypothetical protein